MDNFSYWTYLNLDSTDNTLVKFSISSKDYDLSDIQPVIIRLLKLIESHLTGNSDLDFSHRGSFV